MELKSIRIHTRPDLANCVQFSASIEHEGKKYDWPVASRYKPYHGVLIDEEEWDDAAPLVLERLAAFLRSNGKE